MTTNKSFTRALDNGLRLGDIQAIVDSVINGNSYSSSYNLTATGTSQASALPLTSVINEIDTVVSGTGVNLPSSAGRINTPYKFVVIINNGANALTVYPAQGTTQTIGGTTSISQVAGTNSLYISAQPGKWFQITGSGGGGSVPANDRFDSTGVSVSGGGAAPATGAVNSFFTIPYAGTITGWALESDVSGSVVVDVWKVNGAIPTVANTIVASAPPTLSSQQYVNSTTITGWTTAVAAGDVFGYSITSAATLTKFTLQIFITRT